MTNERGKGLHVAIGTTIENIGRRMKQWGQESAPDASTLPSSEQCEFLERSEEEALALYKTFLQKDPFPLIPPALLNSAHMGDYMERVGLVQPYSPTRRKAASYAMSVGTKIAYFDPQEPAGSGFYHELEMGALFKLKPNSLVYVTTFETFQLPHYIAARFNLHIELVHKGLLLGTGPLVDPGFRGHLVVPLHNMTSNEYELKVGEPFIWTEFTKTTLVDDWRDHDQASDTIEPHAKFAEFSSDKKNKPMDFYLEKARTRVPEGSTRDTPYLFPANAVPAAIETARSRALNAEAAVKRMQQGVKVWKGFGYVAALVALITMAALFWMTIQAFGSTRDIVQGVTSDRAAQSRLTTIPSAYSYDDRFLTAQQLFLDFCALPQKVAADWPGRTSIVRARRHANDAAQAAGLDRPFPFPDSLDRSNCP